MRRIPSWFVVVLSVLLLSSAVYANNVTVSGTTRFAALDGSADDEDHAVNGVFTVSGDLIVNGTITCNDSGGGSACPMTFHVGGNMTMNAGSALLAENRTGAGNGGAITLSVSGNLILHGSSFPMPGAIISTHAEPSANSDGADVVANAGGMVSIENGSVIDTGSRNAQAGRIDVTSGGPATIDGWLLSGASRTILPGFILDGGGPKARGGEVSVHSTSFTEPAVTVDSHAVILSQSSGGTVAGPVTIDGCGIVVRGVVEALGSGSGGTRVAVRSGKSLVIDGRDFGVLGATTGRNGHVGADALQGDAASNSIGIFAGGALSVFGPDPSTSLLYALSGLGTASGRGAAAVHVISLADAVTLSGNAIYASNVANKSDGGAVEISGKGDLNLDHAVVRAEGDVLGNNSSRHGGSIDARSFSGNIIWTNGTGDVRPTGAAVPAAVRGTIALTACGTINTSGSTFPTNGAPVGAFPAIATALCAPVAPSLPAGEPPLVTCNNPPVANPSTASTLEDTAVTITMTGSDPDGNPLTFTIVTPPANGSLGSIFNPTPTSAQVVYTPAADFNGTDSFTFQVDDGHGSTNTAVVTINVTPVNDAPSFVIGPSETTLEDAGPQFFSPWASGISAGPANESAQHVTFTITNNSNSTLFSAGPSVTPSGALSYTSAPNAYGNATLTVVAQDDGGTANGGVDTSAAQTFTINVTAVNDPPSFTKGADQTSLEDAGPQTVAGWATAIDAGPNESGQTVTFTATNDDNALFLTQPAVASNGTLTYTAAANANGVATVTVVAHDDGGIANGGVDTSAPQTFTITIVSVNDAPSFTKGADQNIVEDAGAETVVHWATSISAGPADESSQSVSFTTSNDNNGLFSVQPSVDASGTLTYTPASDANGSATVTVIAHDDGGTANGGVDTSAPQTFAINVASVNDAPSFTKGPDVSLLSDAGPQTYVNWATNISPGPANESAQLVSFLVNNDNNAVFTSQPAVSSGGTLTFTTAVAAPTTTVHVSVSAHDNGGTANGGVDTSAQQTFAINVTHVNQPPLANNDSFDAIGNTELAVGAPGTQPASLAATGSVLANDSDPDSDPLTATLGTVTAGASVTMNPNGTFTYLPPVGFTGDDTFTYVLSDGQGHNVPATVTIHVTKRVLYVKNNGGGSTGRVDSPYATLAAAQAGAATNDTVYVFTGDGTTTGQNAGFTLNHDGERLIGEGVALTVSGTYNGTSNPQLRGAGTRPQISNGAGEAVKVAAASGVISNTEVSGIEITSSALHGVNITNAAAVVMDGDHIASTTNSGVRGTTVSGFSFTNGTIATSGSVAGDGNISFDNLTGSATISNSTFSGAFSDNIRVANTTGSLDRLTLTNVTMNGNNATTGNNAVQLSVGTGATLNVTVTGSHFNSTRAQHFQLSLTGSATSDVVFTGNSISNAQAALSGGGGVVVATGGGGNPALTYNISNNTIRDAVGAALNVTKGSGAGVATGTISDNTIGIASVTDSGSAQGSGILVAHIGGGASTTTVTNNHVAQYNGTGITVQIGDASSGGTGSINAHVTGNAISNPGAFASNGFLLNAGTVSGDQHSVCLTLGGSGSAANSLTGSGANGSTDIRLRQRQATTVSLAGYVGANNDNTAVQTYVQSQNGGTPTVSAANTVPTGGGFTGGTCP